VSDIEIGDSEWQSTFPEEDRRSRLHKSITLNGVQFHLTAFRVKMEDDIQIVGCPEHEGEFECYSDAACPDGPFETIEINGADYVVFGEMACA